VTYDFYFERTAEVHVHQLTVYKPDSKKSLDTVKIGSKKRME